MKVFISWSKAMSLKYALKLKALLENINSDLQVFVSEKDIIAGEDVQEKIIKRIADCDKLILCFTKDNKKAPWLLFEAGYARGLQKKVIPFLFDLDSNWHSWVDNPMNVAREIPFNDSDFVDIFIQSLEIDNTVKNRNKIKQFKKDIIEIKEKNRLVDEACDDLVEKLMSSDAFILDNPTFRDRVAHFATGFETFELYKIIESLFLYTGKYLWIYGRKNMKLFTGSFKELFKYLDEKSYYNQDMDGIDFRCLFLDPSSTEVERAHKDKKIFKLELQSTLARAQNVIGDNERFKKCFRLYSNKREAIIIRLDNCIIYSRPVFDVNGTPQLLTDSQFEVFSVNSKRGQECIHTFEQVWGNAKELY